MKNDKLAAATVAGLLCAAVAAGYIEAAAVAGCAKKVNLVDFSCREFWLNRYQSLIGGLLALAGALGTIGVMRWQSRSTERTNANVARVFAYDALRAFGMKALIEVIEISNFEVLNPTGQRPLYIHFVDLGADRKIIAHLPPQLAKRMLQIEGGTKGVAGNADGMTASNVPLVHVYVGCLLAHYLVVAETLARDLGENIGIYVPITSPEALELLSRRAQLIPMLEDADSVERWLREEFERRKKSI